MATAHRSGFSPPPRTSDTTSKDVYLDGERLTKVLLTPEASPAANYGFDVTPSRLVTGLITERGFCAAAEEALLSLFPEHR